MVYRGAEFTIAQDVDRDIWRWTINLNEHTVESGRRNSRESAFTAAVRTIDRWMMRRTLPAILKTSPAVTPSDPN